MWLFVLDRGRSFVRVSRLVSLIAIVLGDCVKTSDRCNDVSFSLSLERDYV